MCGVKLVERVQSPVSFALASSRTTPESDFGLINPEVVASLTVRVSRAPEVMPELQADRASLLAHDIDKRAAPLHPA